MLPPHAAIFLMLPPASYWLWQDFFELESKSEVSLYLSPGTTCAVEAGYWLLVEAWACGAAKLRQGSVMAPFQKFEGDIGKENDVLDFMETGYVAPQSKENRPPLTHSW